jgi:tetratricopeptide (TPR) repeat protein/CHAT domain-containing protein
MLTVRAAFFACFVFAFPLTGAVSAATPIEEATALNERAIALYKAGKASEALPLARRALGLLEQTLPPGHPAIASVLQNVAVIAKASGRLTEAEGLYKRALAIVEKTLPPGHASIATMVDNLAGLYATQGRFAEAEPLLKRALQIRERAVPANPVDTATSLNNLGHLYRNLGRLTESEQLRKRSLAMLEKALPAGHPTVATAIDNLAGVYQAQGRFAEAEPLYRQALQMREKAVPANTVAVANSLNNIASLYHAQGRYADAEAAFKRTLELREKALPAGHADIALSLHNLASVYEAQGRLSDAEPLLKRALAASEKALPTGHPDIASNLNGLASLYITQGRSAEAEALLKRSLQLREKALPAGHPDIAQSINNLAFLYQQDRRLADAEPMFKRALELHEKALPAGHPDIANDLNNLAVLYEEQGRPAESEPLKKRSLAMLEKALPAGHPKIAASLNNLAGLYQAQGRLADAESLFRQSLEMREKALPAGHPDIAQSLSNLAGLYSAQRALPEAADHARRASAIMIERVKRVAGAERGATEAARRELGLKQVTVPLGWLLGAAWSLAEQRPNERAALSEEAFVAAQWMGQTAAGAALAQMAARFARGESELSRLVREQQNLSTLWQELDRQMVAARSAPSAQRNAATESTLAVRLAEADRQLTALNLRLAKEFPEYTALASPEPLSVAATQAELRPDEALVQFAITGDDMLAWLVTKTSTRWILLPERTSVVVGKVQALRCGLDRDGEWQWSAADQRLWARKKACAALWPNGIAASEPPPFDLRIAYELYETLFGQIKAEIAGKQLIIVPAGALTSLPFQVLVAAKPAEAVPARAATYASAEWLAKAHAITVLPSIASLKSLRGNAGKALAPKPYVAFGNPLLTGPSGTDRRAFDRQSCPRGSDPRVAAAAALDVALASAFRGGLANVDMVRRQAPLPETTDELCAVARELKATESDVYLGARASERTVKSLSSGGLLKTYAIVHFATHGLLAGETESLARSRAEPALLLTPPESASEADDGLLTASEIAQLELDADWVILSACNTAAGAGDGLGAEALSGLARAFFYSGARALLVSHWSVDSDGAVKLTTRAIAELQRNPAIGRAEGMRRAMLALMTDTSRPADWMPAAHPAVWAPFVVVGEGRR